MANRTHLYLTENVSLIFIHFMLVFHVSAPSLLSTSRRFMVSPLCLLLIRTRTRHRNVLTFTQCHTNDIFNINLTLCFGWTVLWSVCPISLLLKWSTKRGSEAIIQNARTNLFYLGSPIPFCWCMMSLPNGTSLLPLNHPPHITTLWRPNQKSFALSPSSNFKEDILIF